MSGLKGGFQQVQDYLLEEVLARQPAAVQDGMIKVSLLDRFCAPLVEALCLPAGDTAAAAMTGEEFIRAVNAANLFVIPLDVEGEWFRYHHLFRDLLRSQLERHHTPNEIAVLHVPHQRVVRVPGPDHGVDRTCTRGRGRRAGGRDHRGAPAR